MLFARTRWEGGYKRYDVVKRDIPPPAGGSSRRLLVYSVKRRGAWWAVAAVRWITEGSDERWQESLVAAFASEQDAEGLVRRLMEEANGNAGAEPTSRRDRRARVA